MRIKRKRTKKLLNNLKEQVEFYFSDANLARDKFLANHVGPDGTNFMPLNLLTTFNCLKEIGATPELICRAVKNSLTVYVSKDNTMIARKCAFINKSYDMDQNTIYIECLPIDTTIQWIKEMCRKLGPIKYISLPKFKSGFIKGFAFIEFENTEDANKACYIINHPPRNFFPQKYAASSFNATSRKNSLIQESHMTAKELISRDHRDRYHDLGCTAIISNPVCNPDLNVSKNLPEHCFLNHTAHNNAMSELHKPLLVFPIDPKESNKVTVNHINASSVTENERNSFIDFVLPNSTTSTKNETGVRISVPNSRKRPRRKRSISEPSVTNDEFSNHGKRLKYETMNNAKLDAGKTCESKKSVICEDTTPSFKVNCNIQIANLPVNDVAELIAHGRTLAEGSPHTDNPTDDKNEVLPSCHSSPALSKLSKPSIQSAVVDVTPLVKKKPRKYRKRKRKFQNNLKTLKPNSISIVAMTKLDWLECKKCYIRQQRSEMGNLKSILHKGTHTDTVYIKRHAALNQSSDDIDVDTEDIVEENVILDKPESPRNNIIKKRNVPTFVPGVIVHIASIPNSLNISPKLPDFLILKTHFSQYGKVCYVDVKADATQGYIRYSDSDSAQQAILDEQTYALQLLTGTEEEKYWDALLVSRQLKRSRERPKKRGRQIVVGRAERTMTMRSKQHIKFNEDFEH
ncbi:la-related protein 7-like [Clavelina lepadiformis]|uniref:la-related protein 7-like n=1 Tax=Clavelina lepadiformis TaxID=159417 RepID=UPI004041E206